MKNEARKALARVFAFALVVSGTSPAFPVLAFASEEEASGGIDVLLPQWDEFVPMLIAFLILLFVLGKFAWPAFSAMLDKREKTIKDSLEKSEIARIESEHMLEEYKQQLAEAKMQAAQIITDAKQTGETVKADITEKAQREATAMIKKAKDAIEAEKRAAIAELQGSIADTSIAVAARLIGNDLNEDEHRRIIERYVSEAGNFDAN